MKDEKSNDSIIEAYWKCLTFCNDLMIKAKKLEAILCLSKMGLSIVYNAHNFGKLHDVQIDNIINIIRVGNITTVAKAPAGENDKGTSKEVYAEMCNVAWKEIMGIKT